MPVCSIVIPVLNEAGIINALIEHVLGLEGGGECQIIVVDADELGGTVKAIGHEGVVCLASERGRARQMNAGAARASGDVIIFLHADTRLPDNGLEAIGEALADESIVGGAFALDADTRRLSVRALARMSSARSRVTRVPFGDQALFFRGEYFAKIGGFADMVFLEDVELMRRIRRRGDRIKILKERVKTSARRWEKEGILYTTLRNQAVLILFGLGVSADRLARFYRSD